MGEGSAGLFWAGEVGPHGEERTFSISRTLGVSQEQLHVSCVRSCRAWCRAGGALFTPLQQEQCRGGHCGGSWTLMG